MATQDRFAPGSSVGLLEFGAFSSAELHSRFVLGLIVVADDHCCLYWHQRSSATAIAFSPEAHRGNTGHPLCADACQHVPTQATIRVGWRIMAQSNQVLRGACRQRQTAKGGLSFPRLARRQAHSSFSSVQ